MNWQNQPVSMLDSMYSKDPQPTTLGAWVTATKQHKQDAPKRQRQVLMPHGLFAGGRKADDCTRHSVVFQFDIDRKHNPGMDADAIKRKAASCPGVVFCALSAGSGVYGFALRRGDLDDQLDALERQLGVNLDRMNSKSVAALRFASYDSEPYEEE